MIDTEITFKVGNKEITGMIKDKVIVASMNVYNTLPVHKYLVKGSDGNFHLVLPEELCK